MTTPTTPASADAGTPAPAFDLEADDGARRSLRDFSGKWLVIYFYPRDNTPGCTREAQAFSEAAARLAKLGASVVGVSRDSIKSHGSFRDKLCLRFPLLSDPDLAAHRAYGAWGKKTLYGRETEGTIRSTFLVSPGGTIARSWRGVRVDGHVEAVIDALEEARGGRKGTSTGAKGKRGAKA